MKYYLKPDGIIVGAIPAEGGLLWALGRFLTSRQWLHKNTNIDYDKLICWEHPNYADFILKKLDQNFLRSFLKVGFGYSANFGLQFNLSFLLQKLSEINQQNIFLEEVIKSLPRVMSLFDCDKTSNRSFGLGDRFFWAWG